uniref:Uncharacterized protein n=1 Tax=Octactis speculum TaxID=3111310 RepID=A0A7S2G5Y7_9STRA|mmetsp:Transcript_38647/g.52395  ORF Transcript_38647/g.52395 Transcript_38647/m.52395 type:complete len:101 (+) Transcript_38647:487-789(+)
MLVWPLYMSLEEGASMWDSMDAISLRAFAALLEVSSLPPVATAIATLPVVHTGVGLPLGCAGGNPGGLICGMRRQLSVFSLNVGGGVIVRCSWFKETKFI